MEIKVIAPRLVLSARRHITLAEVGKEAAVVCPAMEADALKHNMTINGPWVFVYRNLPQDSDTPCEIEFCLPVQSAEDYNGDHLLKTLAGATCATHLYEGPLDGLFGGYATLLQEAAAQNHRLSGDSREIYHCWQGPQAAGNRVELQFALASA